MKTRFTVIFALLLPALLFGQGNLAEVPLELKFRDARTGKPVQPLELEIISPELSGETLSIDAESGRAEIPLPPGRYDLLLRAAGYQLMNAPLVVAGNQAAEITFFLDPAQPTAQFEPQRLAENLRADATLVSGFITDRQSGEAITGAEVQVVGLETASRSDREGFFQLYLPADQLFHSLQIAKHGFVTRRLTEVETWPGGDWQVRIALERGSGETRESMKHSGGTQESQPADRDCDDCDPASGHKATIYENSTFPPPVLLPSTIRVGRDCPSPTTCSRVEVYSMQTYTKLVLPAEWFSCWGSLANGLNSLQAGAVAIRSFATWHVFHPLTATYDICDNTFCQFLGSSHTSNADLAVDLTERFVLIDQNSEVTRSEYSAENNNSGCGDGYSGTGSSWPCIYDPVCMGQPRNGHGRGLCQWGSARWATGTRILTSAPCSNGSNHGFGTKIWPDILSHYYPTYQVTQGASATILNAIASPGVVSPGQTFQIEYTVEAGPSMNIFLGASVRPSGGNWIDDPANDTEVTVNAGTSVVSRPFRLPSNAPVGSYDMLVALWFDVDGNQQINTGDFRFDSATIPNAFQVSLTGLDEEPEIASSTFSLEQNYPNPFNGQTVIRYRLPKRSQVVIRLFDALGKEISLLKNEEESAGVHALSWRGEGFSSGKYFYRLVATDLQSGAVLYQQTRQLVLAR